MYSAKLVSASGVCTVYHNSRSLSFDPTHPKYKDLLDLLDNNQYDELVRVLDVAKSVSRKFSGSGVSVEDGRVLYNGEEVHGVICNRIVEFTESGRDVGRLVKFLASLMQNPSKNSVDQLYSFLERNNHPLLEDGRILMYKRVRDDFTDHYTGKFDNSVGKIVSMPRNQVSDRSEKECDRGLHLSSLSYCRDHYCAGRGRLITCAVAAKDVVSVCDDRYNFSKIRVSSYEVLEELKDHYRSYSQDDVDDWSDEWEDNDTCEDCDQDLGSCDCCEVDDDDLD